MTMIMKQKNSRDLSYIDNLEDLQAQIKSVKITVKQKEKDLEERWNRLPQETLKSTVGAVVPFFLNNTVAAKTFNIIKTAGSLFFSRSAKEKGNIKETLFASAKQLGLFTLLRTAYNIWRKK
jgi:hypothetical protein